MDDITVKIDADTDEFVEAIDDAIEALNEFEEAIERVNTTDFSITVDDPMGGTTTTETNLIELERQTRGVRSNESDAR